MRHGMSGRKLNRTSPHRKALFENLATSLIRHEQIRTTLPKAKDLRRVVEPLITKARAGDLAARREVAKTIKDKTVLKKLFDEVAPLFKDRPGGYTRVLKAGFRKGDNAPMAIIALTEQTEAATAAPVEAKDEAPVAEAAPAEEKAEAKAEAKPAKKAAPKKAAAKKPAAKKAPAKKDAEDK